MGNLKSLQGSSKYWQNSSLSGTKDLLSSEKLAKGFSYWNPKCKCSLCCFCCLGLAEMALNQFAKLAWYLSSFLGRLSSSKGRVLSCGWKHVRLKNRMRNLCFIGAFFSCKGRLFQEVKRRASTMHWKCIIAHFCNYKVLDLMLPRVMAPALLGQLRIPLILVSSVPPLTVNRKVGQDALTTWGTNKSYLPLFHMMACSRDFFCSIMRGVFYQSVCFIPANFLETFV